MTMTLMDGMTACMDTDGNIIAQEPSESYKECIRMSDRSLYVNRSLAKFLAHQLAQIRQDAESHPDKSEAYATLGAATAQSLRSVTERGEFLERRLNHAVKTLKRKGLWSDTLSGLDQVCAEKELVRARGLIQVVRCCMGEAIATIAGHSELDDASWKIGIEMAMSEHEPRIMDTDSLFGPKLERNFPYIAANTLMAAYGAKLNQCLTDDTYQQDMHDLIMEKYLSDPEITREMAAYISGLGKETIMAAAQTVKKAQQQTDAEKQRADQLQAQLSELQKSGIPAEREASRLREENQSLEGQLAKAQTELRRYREALDLRDQRISDLTAENQDAAGLQALPEKGVVFLGGHPNMIKKIKDSHPKWLFVDGTDSNFKPFQAPELLLYWDKHMSHTAWQRAKGFAGPDTISIYLKSTNVDRLELEMAQKWTAARPDPEEA